VLVLAVRVRHDQRIDPAGTALLRGDVCNFCRKDTLNSGQLLKNHIRRPVCDTPHRAPARRHSVADQLFSPKNIK
jgi:hypothetical protein